MFAEGGGLEASCATTHLSSLKPDCESTKPCEIN